MSGVGKTGGVNVDVATTVSAPQQKPEQSVEAQIGSVKRLVAHFQGDNLPSVKTRGPKPPVKPKPPHLLTDRKITKTEVQPKLTPQDELKASIARIKSNLRPPITDSRDKEAATRKVDIDPNQGEELFEDVSNKEPPSFEDQLKDKVAALRKNMRKPISDPRDKEAMLKPVDIDPRQGEENSEDFYASLESLKEETPLYAQVDKSRIYPKEEDTLQPDSGAYSQAYPLEGSQEKVEGYSTLKPTVVPQKDPEPEVGGQGYNTLDHSGNGTKTSPPPKPPRSKPSESPAYTTIPEKEGPYTEIPERDNEDIYSTIPEELQQGRVRSWSSGSLKTDEPLEVPVRPSNLGSEGIYDVPASVQQQGFSEVPAFHDRKEAIEKGLEDRDYHLLPGTLSNLDSQLKSLTEQIQAMPKGKSLSLKQKLARRKAKAAIADLQHSKKGWKKTQSDMEAITKKGLLSPKEKDKLTRMVDRLNAKLLPALTYVYGKDKAFQHLLQNIKKS